MSVLHNLEEIKENAVKAYCDLDEDMMNETAQMSDMN